MAKKVRKHPELVALKGLIREKKTTYRELAADLEIGLNTLSDKINGFYPFNGVEMEKIASILDIDPKDVAKFFLPSYCKTHHKSA